ncbi:PREDICTED: mitochondrial import inner membrane translocase subunit Tim8 A-like [Priapulus caudatus]|uniref:Mitochondrial import inner membrane translocase subunit n=1 Tax=Priapulus caudatus TaxID=37621 RepID=A0ABM1EUA6_PRICU|nr:PREDICTED: mitochondrial import inner membrane translocase subunit Tim8 A-like [Priapulus caudatus]
MADSERADPEMARFVEGEMQKQRFQHIVIQLAEQCWDVCAVQATARLDHRAETCLANCVERFIDVSNFVAGRLERSVASAHTQPDYH